MYKFFQASPRVLNLIRRTALLPLLFLMSAAADSAYPLQNSIVKIMATHNHPDYASPWQRHGIHSVTGSGVIIDQQRILTNAHVVADQTQVEVQREGSGITYSAEVAYVCHSCDLAILNVDDPRFFQKTTPLEIDGLPKLQSRVNVYGFPTGGETISITEGIVSRIEVDFYVHSADRYLLVQVDAAINPGNSGGPAISNGKIIGIAMQAMENAENIGYIVPAPIIKHFLEDIEDGRYNGFPELDVYVQMLQNKSLRESLAIPEEYGGMLVTGIARNSPAFKKLKPGDVILKMDKHIIDRDGKVELDGLRVESTHLEYSKQVDETVELTVLRNGKIMDLRMKLSPRIPRANNREYDRLPSYFTFGGLVFQPLSNGYLKSHHDNQYSMFSYIEQYTMEGYERSIPDRIHSDREQVVILSRVLPDRINQGYKDMEGSVIYSVNDTPIKDLKQLVKLVKQAKGKFLKFTTDFGSQIILDLNLAKKRAPIILQNYQIFSDTSADLN